MLLREIDPRYTRLNEPYELLYSMRTVRYLLASAIAFWAMSQLTGCATAIQTYPGERLSRDKVAVVHNDAGLGGTLVDFVALDGKKVEGRRLALLPGKHEISVRLVGYEGIYTTHRKTGWAKTIEMNLDAAAGEVYWLRGAVQKSQTGTGKRICTLVFVPNTFSPGDKPLPGAIVNDCGG